VLFVAAKQMNAVITSATATRSSRPRRSHRGRGVGGLVTPASNAAASLRLRSEIIAPA
jgi:hypothetical protein